MAPFVSYAQNYEDVILWRTLKHVENGFYVDCGAFDPTVHSVTKAFYDRGWRGINIEPVPHLLYKFTDSRPRDVNLGIALSDNSGSGSFYEIVDSGLSTFRRDIAQQHLEAGFVARRLDVRTSRLTDVLQQHAPANIHFLKIDVEGAEQLVLGGLDLEVLRPWIIIVEAIDPLTREPNHQEWEQLLVNRDYRFVYFDGLNRFYVASEHADLIQQLTLPPNIFDNFIQSAQFGERERSEQELALIMNSTSWRLTAPMRGTKRAFQTLLARIRAYRDLRARRSKLGSAIAPPPYLPAAD